MARFSLMVFCVVLARGVFDWMPPKTESSAMRAVLDFAAWVSSLAGVAVAETGLSLMVFSSAEAGAAFIGCRAISGGNSMREV